MEIGTRIPHTGRQASPGFVRRWCTTAEAAGFDSLWAVDHLVMPRHTSSDYTLGRRPATIAENGVSDRLSPNFEMMCTLAFVAAITERIKLGTAVTVLPIRNAVLNARQLATVDRYSGGRVLCGVGAGWLREEAEAMNMPWDRRGARADEHIALLRRLWTAPGTHVEFHGTFWQLPPMDPEPRPHQRPIPILVGGHSDAAMDRAARLGDGWIAADVSPDHLAALLPKLHAAADRHGRDPASLPVYCGTGRQAVSPDVVRRYEALGVHSLQLLVEDIGELERIGHEILSERR